MPRNTRNFWLDLDVDGRDTSVTTGPASKEGGFRQEVFIRDGGRVEQALTISGYAHRDGTLRLVVKDGDGNTVHEVERHRDKPKAELAH